MKAGLNPLKMNGMDGLYINKTARYPPARYMIPRITSWPLCSPRQSWPGDHALYPTYPFRHHPAPHNVESSSATRQVGGYKQRYIGDRS